MKLLHISFPCLIDIRNDLPLPSGSYFHFCRLLPFVFLSDWSSQTHAVNWNSRMRNIPTHPPSSGSTACSELIFLLQSEQWKPCHAKCSGVCTLVPASVIHRAQPLSTEHRLSVEFASPLRALVEVQGALGGLQWVSGGWNLNTIFPLQKPRKL